MKTGLAKEELRSQLRPAVDQKVLQVLLASLVKKGVIEQVGAEIKASGHTVTLQVNEQEMEQKISEIYRRADLTPPNLKEVLADFGAFPERQIRQVIDLLVSQGNPHQNQRKPLFPCPSHPGPAGRGGRLYPPRR